MTVLSSEAQAQLTRWPSRAQALLAELLEDAPTTLQRELLQRAVAAGHTPNEVHAFADQLRAMSDDESFAACTLDEGGAPTDYTVAQLLRAQSDPLYAFELKGGALEPSDDEVLLTAPKPPVDLTKLRRITASFVADSTDANPVRSAASRGVGALALPRSRTRGSSALLLEPLLAQATRAHDLNWQESQVDVPHGLSLEAAIAAAATVVGDGLPVPLALGPRPGVSVRLILALQINASRHTRAWQLYDPHSRELVWANEGDLLARNELPFSDKYHRRITLVALPSRRPPARE